jgi:hypothetical protein
MRFQVTRVSLGSYSNTRPTNHALIIVPPEDEFDNTRYYIDVTGDELIEFLKDHGKCIVNFDLGSDEGPRVTIYDDYCE